MSDSSHPESSVFPFFPEPNHISLPFALFTVLLPQLSPNAFKILCVVLTNSPPPIQGRLSTLTGLRFKEVAPAIEELLKKNMIRICKDYAGAEYVFPNLDAEIEAEQTRSIPHA